MSRANVTQISGENHELQLVFVCLFCFTAYQPHRSFNQVKENKSEKKFKGEVLGINDKL